MRTKGKNRNLGALKRKTSVFFDISLRQHEHKKARMIVNFLAFLLGRWISIKFDKLVVNISLLDEARFSGKSVRPVFQMSQHAAVKIS